MIMGRGRGKGKKFSAANHEDAGSGEEEKIPVQKKRGRPQKPLKDEIDEEEFEKVEEEDSENTKNGVLSKETKSSVAAENGKKRKRNLQAKEKPDSIKVENGVGTRSSTDDSTKSNGFRHNGSRRKSKPRRAAENGKKRKRNLQAKEKPDSIKVENGVGTRSSTDDSTKSNGFRHNGSRRKSKPRRAAEAGVECK